MTKDWVHAMPKEYLHTDGTIALEPTPMRHMGVQTDLWLDWMHKAAAISENALDRKAVEIADITGFTLREVYTLFHSP